MTVVSSVTGEYFSRSLGRRADWKNLNKLSRYEAAEIYTFSLKQATGRSREESMDVGRFIVLKSGALCT